MVKISEKCAITFLIIALLGIAIIYYYFYNQKGRDGNKNASSIEYYEIVKEDSSCAELCFLEYIVTSNGDIMEKFVKDFEDNEKNGINLFGIETLEAKKAIEKVREFFERTSSYYEIECDRCAIFHIYLNDSGRTRAYSVKVQDASNDVIELFKSAKNLAAQSYADEKEFYHFYYGRNEGGYLDYHFFASGTAIREIFGDKNGELVDSKTLTVAEYEIEKMKKLLTGNFFREKSVNINCKNGKYKWGYVEIKSGQEYNGIYTCGEGTKNSDVMFNYLVNQYH